MSSSCCACWCVSELLRARGEPWMLAEWEELLPFTHFIDKAGFSGTYSDSYGYCNVPYYAAMTQDGKARGLIPITTIARIIHSNSDILKCLKQVEAGDVESPCPHCVTKAKQEVIT